MVGLDAPLPSKIKPSGPRMRLFLTSAQDVLAQLIREKEATPALGVRGLAQALHRSYPVRARRQSNRDIIALTARAWQDWNVNAKTVRRILRAYEEEEDWVLIGGVDGSGDDARVATGAL